MGSPNIDKFDDYIPVYLSYNSPVTRIERKLKKDERRAETNDKAVLPPQAGELHRYLSSKQYSMPQ